MLDRAVIKTMAKQVRTRLREVQRPDKRLLEAELEGLEKQIAYVVDSLLSAVGRSEALTAKLKDLEAAKARVAAQLSAEVVPPRIVPDVESALRERVQMLECLPRDCTDDPALLEKARMSVKAMLGEVAVTEDGDAIYSEIDIGRAYIKNGAEERT